MKYEIANRATGHSFGVYDARDEDEALDLLAQDAGYGSYSYMCAALDKPEMRERELLLVTPVEPARKARS